MNYILLAEDDIVDQDLMINAFAKLGCEKTLKIVNDGEELLDYIFRKKKYADLKEFPNPDLILMDLNMPKMDGKRVLKELRDAGIHDKIIVILTTSNDPEDVRYTYQMGAKTFITKPDDLKQYDILAKEICNYWFGIATLQKNM